MVLINALDETIESLSGNDEGKYLEERWLLKQMGKFLDLGELYEPLKNHLKSGVNEKLLTPEYKKRYNDALWLSILANLYEIIPDEKMAEDFKVRFEDKSNKEAKNDRIASLQNDIIAYFIESMKRTAIDYPNKNESTNTNDNINLLLKEFSEYLIAPGSCILDNPENNIGLDESIEFFEMKKQEYLNYIKGISVK